MNPNGNDTYKDEQELKRCKVSEFKCKLRLTDHFSYGKSSSMATCKKQPLCCIHVSNSSKTSVYLI